MEGKNKFESSFLVSPVDSPGFTATDKKLYSVYICRKDLLTYVFQVWLISPFGNYIGYKEKHAVTYLGQSTLFCIRALCGDLIGQSWHGGCNHTGTSPCRLLL